MTVLPCTREVCWHEASHCASLILSGLTPQLVRVDWPTDQLLGAVRMDWENHDPTPDVMREVLISLLQGPIAEGGLFEAQTTWPIDPTTGWQEGTGRDVEQIQFIVDSLGLDRIDWLGIVNKAVSRARSPRFRHLVVEIATALEHTELLFQHELIALTERMTHDTAT